MKSASWRIIEIILLRYPDIKKEYEEYISNIMGSSGSSPKTPDEDYSRPQSVTEAKALKMNSAYAERLKKEIEAVELAYRDLRPEEQKVIRIRYWSGYKTAVPYDKMPNCNYSDRQMKRIVKKTVLKIGRYVGEIR